MESILEFIKPICFFGKNKKNKKHHNKKQRHPLEKNKQPTLQDCILSSPSFNKSSPLPTTSNKRVHPNNDGSKERLLVQKPSPLPSNSSKRVHPNDDGSTKRLLVKKPSALPATSNKRVHPDADVSVKRLLLEEEETGTKMEGDSSSRGKRKKRVSFRMPEVADVFIILAASPTAHDSSDLKLL